MKKMKKILAFVMAMAMVLGMTVIAFAENGKREASDATIVTITGLEMVDGTDTYPTVTLYRIAKGEYDTDFTGYSWADGVSHALNESLNREEVDIAGTAKGLLDGSIQELIEDDSNGVTNGAVNDGTFTATVKAGAYIAIITGGGTTIYNPILLTATYTEDSNDLVGGEVAVEETYLYGSTAVVKSSKPSIEKVADTSANDGDKKTASVGDVITYTLTPTMPSYPVNAANKTVYIEDVMDNGLTFDYSSLTIKLGNGTDIMADSTLDSGATTFTYDGTVIAKAVELNNGFRLVFLYEALEDEDAGGVSSTFDDLTVTYEATLNDAAVVGGEGNTNNASLKYTNNPSEGSSYEDPTDEDEDPNTQEAKDTDTIYTYQLAFHKVTTGTDEGLADAVFGIYSRGESGVDGTVDEDSLVDTVTTDENGYAVSKKVEAGTYYIKEITAPKGYSLNTEVFEIEVSYSDATTAVTTTVTYTSDENGTTQVGWLKNDTFYALQDKPEGSDEDVQPAYIESVEIEEVGENSAAGNGTALLNTDIPNTKLASLPSTGGIGTTIFTIGGCAIMILAAALFFASRRRTEK